MPETQQPVAPGADELQRRRRQIGRGLRRSHVAIVVASFMVGFLAIAAVWLSREAQHRAEDARSAQRRAEVNAAEARVASQRLWEFSSRAARQQRLSRTFGQRSESLDIIREAARFQPSRELRDEALSALLLPDVGTNIVWRAETSFEFAAAYDATFEHFIQNCDHGRAIVRRVADGAVLMDEPGLGGRTLFWQFSPDGQLAAIAFDAGQIGLWDWRTTNLIARIPTVGDLFWDEPSFDFSPDKGLFWFVDTNQNLACLNLQSRELTSAITLAHPASAVRLSPSGELAALAGTKDLEVHDVASGRLRASLALTNRIRCFAWQPGNERLAVGCYGGLFLWSIGTTNLVRLKEGDVTITDLSFNPDGDLLFLGGYNEQGEIWDTRQWRPVSEGRRGHLTQLAADETKVAIFRERVGYGINRYLAPLGVHSWPALPSFGTAHWSADVDPKERWLLTAHVNGWLIRDADTGQELGRASCGDALSVSFSADGSNVLAWTQVGLQRWPLSPGDDPRTFRVGAPQMIWKSSGRPIDVAVIAAGRGHAACCQDGLVTVVDLLNPGTPVQFRLRLPSDNAHVLSPDGRWLLTGYHNQHGVDWYDCQSGKWLRRFALEGFASVVFDPNTGRLFTCTASDHCEWNPKTGELMRKIAWRSPVAAQSFLGFAPDHRLALVMVPPSSFQWYDLEAGRDFATLDFRDPQTVHTCYWSRDGGRIFLFGRDGGITRLDLSTLRAGLDSLGLNWSDADPSRDFDTRPESLAVSQAEATRESATAARSEVGLAHPGELIWFVSTGLLVTVGIGLYVLSYQRRLFTSYRETEALAEQRAGELRNTHAALAHNEKMRALGTMAAGVAHDFNNLLSVIRLSSELIEECTEADGTTRENFDAIRQSIQRGRGIVHSMLGYARDDGEARPFAPAALVSDAVALLSKSFLSGLVLEIEVDAAVPDVFGRRGRVEQMLLNLIVNAAEAMGGRGTLRLSARGVDETGHCVLPPRASAGYVELSVVDSGPGIRPEIQPRIFEPFFTTKNKGPQHGTGLGLSMLYTIAKEDGLGVAVESVPDCGTTFRLLLPVTPGPGRDLPIASSTGTVHSQT
jgi:signal transduction histidine kinase/WD40 repeat protein